MGGLLAVHAVAFLPAGTVDAVLATTLLDPGDPATRRAASRFPILPPPAWLAPLDRVRLPIRLVAPLPKMANDPALARAVARDPVGAGRSAPMGFWRSWMQYAYALEAFDRAPVVLAHPGADRWTPIVLSRRALARITAVPTREVLLPRGGPLPRRAGGGRSAEARVRGAAGPGIRWPMSIVA